ncbi:hypothetical protein AB1Y20_011922 [Prymnesium parvum]|uniref:histone acetyltransferase n=1 Tax=Prymnesium parvum TaxID=97485 RepID=A0AB34IP20_PRYPA
MAAAPPPEAWLPPTAAEAADPSAAAVPASTATISPLERELLHEAKEARGELRFLILRNDGSPLACERLLELKNIFGKQLPKMGKQYIARLVFDRQHESLAAIYAGEVVGGITYRPHPSQAFAEVVFCAVSAEQQVRGYGARIMNQLMERLKRQGITHLLTYADNHAIGYFRKQGFNKQVTMKRERWHGYIKDYDGATLMEFIIDPRIDYLSTKRLADQQRNAIMQKIQTMTSTQVPRSGAAVEPGALPLAVPGLEHTSWRPSELHCSLGGEALPLSACLLRVFEAIQSHEDAWPFRKSVSVSDAPDYYQIIKDPLDLSVIKARLARRPPYYATVDMLRADICRMCDNCRVYNGEGNPYWDCAVRLEQFARARFAEISVAKRVKVASPQRDPAPQS